MQIPVLTDWLAILISRLRYCQLIPIAANNRSTIKRKTILNAIFTIYINYKQCVCVCAFMRGDLLQIA